MNRLTSKNVSVMEDKPVRRLKRLRLFRSILARAKNGDQRGGDLEPKRPSLLKQIVGGLFKRGRLGWAASSLALASMLVSGCGFARQAQDWEEVAEADYYEESAVKLDYPDLATPVNGEVLSTPSPLTALSQDETEYEFLTLEEAVQQALMNSRVLRDMGATILRSPSSAKSTYDVALQEMDPRFGVAAALSAFDTSFEATTFVEKNDRAVNNQFLGGGTRQFKQDLSTLQTQLSKRGATGTEYAFRNYTDYDANNAPGNRFRSVFQTWFDAEVRHPLLQGSGTEFNRIAGPNATPGAMGGVVLARLNTDISLTEFEMSVRDFVSNVENAYWDLYFAYRDLDAKITARDEALKTWQAVKANQEAGREGGEADKEAQAREQYFRFQEQVQNSLSGRRIDGTRTNNGSSGGTFRGQGGVLTAERRLRLMMGVPITGGQLLRPQDEPIEAKVMFDWDSILIESLTRRPEIRRQKWVVKRRENELRASENFLLPTLDVIGRYRWRGFGHNYLPQGKDNGRFDNAWEDLFEGDTQEWQLGLEFSMPFGRRQAHVGVEHAELMLARDRALLAEQEREVVHELSNAIAEMDRAWATLETAEDRRLAAAEQLDAVRLAFKTKEVSFDQVLEAQRRFLDSETSYYRVLVEYTIAIRNVHYEKGSLLDYNEIYLNENVWPAQAYADAMNRRRNTIPAEWLHGVIGSPAPVTQGRYGQNIDTSGATYTEPMPMPTPASKPAVPAAPPANNDINAVQADPNSAPKFFKGEPKNARPIQSGTNQPVDEETPLNRISFESDRRPLEFSEGLVAPPVPTDADFEDEQLPQINPNSSTPLPIIQSNPAIDSDQFGDLPVPE